MIGLCVDGHEIESYSSQNFFLAYNYKYVTCCRRRRRRRHHHHHHHHHFIFGKNLLCT
jgi:hypothetical protein